MDLVLYLLRMHCHIAFRRLRDLHKFKKEQAKVRASEISEKEATIKSIEAMKASKVYDPDLLLVFKILFPIHLRGTLIICVRS